MQLRSRKTYSSASPCGSLAALSPPVLLERKSHTRKNGNSNSQSDLNSENDKIARHCSSVRRDRTRVRPRRNVVARKKCRLSTTEEDLEEATRRRFRVLQSAFGPEDRVDDSSWITGTLIDLVLWKFANLYKAVHFLPTAFYHLHLEAALNATGSPWQRRYQGQRTKRDYVVRDVLGCIVNYNRQKPLIFIVNVDQIHWNLFRLQLNPIPKLQLFEPMGRLASRSGISYRSVPRAVIEWLDVCYPQDKCWLERTESAITNKQQVSGFDCGVACLLYADKCGRGQSIEEINDEIDQQAITSFRKQLQLQLGAQGNDSDG
ncbi:ubiquitin-1-specific protease [Plasmopara halstedii]|uniref:Ubiquitin-1-specific protease n=1 Tax=Plasmopara halstedii TaxID=4781 RepID=A0A0P1AGV0_PLAHL|nr:ubiquitin-1-specific protease [Plasmopara halstedii]CEG39697.1 ubiquitin-1-specific protease [Plasmopara halstedii]|eukprot:XP_024576066.1 ubiquitin-1-specific protease [Plasmopara halstedii]